MFQRRWLKLGVSLLICLSFTLFFIGCGESAPLHLWYTLTASVEGQGTMAINAVGDTAIEGIQTATVTYVQGTQVTLTATAENGWTFDRWEGDLTGNENPATITMMNADKSVTAVFVVE